MPSKFQNVFCTTRIHWNLLFDRFRAACHRVIVSNLFIFKNVLTQFEVGLHVLRFDKYFRSHWCMKLKHFSINYWKFKQVTKWSHNVLSSLCIISTEIQLINSKHFILSFVLSSTRLLRPIVISIDTDTHSILPFAINAINLRMWEKRANSQLKTYADRDHKNTDYKMIQWSHVCKNSFESTDL